MHTNSLKLLAPVAVAGLLASGLASAASDGTLGLTSTGTLDITVTKGDMALITKLDDIALGTFSTWGVGDGNLTGNDDVCVFATTANYIVTAESANSSGTDFRLSDSGGTNFITYTVTWDDGPGGAFALSEGTASGPQVPHTEQDCGGALSTNATVAVSISEANMIAAASGIYSDTLTLLIAPQ